MNKFNNKFKQLIIYKNLIKIKLTMFCNKKFYKKIMNKHNKLNLTSQFCFQVLIIYFCKLKLKKNN